MKFVVTGAAGYIGSQLCKELSKSEENYIVAIDRNEINHSFLNKKFILDFNNIYPKDLFLEVDCVIHLGGSSLIGPSLNNPKKSYEDNLLGSIKLLNSCLKNNVKNIIFASSASVYGNNENNKIFSENDECKPLSPYARSKFFMEKVIKDYSIAYNLNAVCLRFFNIAGADLNLQFGPSLNSTHIISRLIKSALNKESFTLNGNDFNTPDGSCIRDYVHIQDIAKGIVKASEFLLDNEGFSLFNLGEGNGYSNFEIIKAVNMYTPLKPDIIIGPSKKQDAAILVANTKLSRDMLGWEVDLGLKEIIKSSYEWYKLKLRK